MPGRAIGDQPSQRSDRQRSAIPPAFKDQMWDTLAQQMLAHCHTGLTAADDQHFDLFD